jgi:excisionase family DNA binding protein
MIEQAQIKASLELKEVWTLKELAFYTGMKESQIYSLTSLRKIPHSKPTGGKVYFHRDKIKEWLLSGQVTTTQDIEDRANKYLNK